MLELLKHLPTTGDEDAVLEGFLTYAEEAGLDLYPAQEEAILEIISGNNVIVSTPTGSGKSLVALAAHFAGLARGERSWYTAPIKALVSEKFFSLCRELGTDRVGMITGDASVNAGAPVICCTAEILANAALRDGALAPVDIVVMDEFHYYGDRDRGWAWQVPLLEMPQAQYILMSATLGPTERFETALTTLNNRPTSLVLSTKRPVPLHYTYRVSPIHETVADVLAMNQAPVYIVHFTQKSATDAAQALTSIEVVSKAEKAAIKEAIGGFSFDTVFGNDLKRFVSAGIGVHHAGLLPKYRLLVEKLAQGGLLKVICGTDTLGVGVNVPIRTVLFTQLCKWDGVKTRVLSNRDFQQIAGRAGRKGFDDVGYVWCQAPPHVVENRRLEDKEQADPKKKRKFQRKKPPDRGYVHWDEKTFDKLATGDAEPLGSKFSVSHSMLLHLLDRPGDGCGAARRILANNHDSRDRQRTHIRRAVGIYRSLVDAEIVEMLEQPDEYDRMVRVHVDLQDEFALNQPLSLFAVEVLELLDPEDDTHGLDTLSVIESVLENPGVILARQLDHAKTELITALKMDGVEYDERMRQLDELTWPQPNREILWDAFTAWATHHPWVAGETVRPKSIVRDLFERAMTFREYVTYYGIKGVEGVLLRYLSDTYKAMVQTIPLEARTEAVDDIIEWLGAMVRRTDSSLIDEWEKMTDPAAADAEPDEVRPPVPVDITTNARAFGVMVRNEVFRWVQMLAAQQYHAAAEHLASGAGGWSASDLESAMAPYWEEFDDILVDSAARGSNMFTLTRGTDPTKASDPSGQDTDRWAVEQVLADPDEFGEWRLSGHVDIEASKSADRPVVVLEQIGRL